jgi:hypothetical protein
MSNKYMNQYYKQLIGFRIIKFKYQNDGYGDLFPVFTVKRDDEILELTVSQDPEGNGEGFLFISPPN